MSLKRYFCEEPLNSATTTHYCGKRRKQKLVDWITTQMQQWRKLVWWPNAPNVNTQQTFFSSSNHKASFCYRLFSPPAHLQSCESWSGSSKTLLRHTLISMSDAPSSLCLSTAQRLLRGPSSQGACSCLLASSCAQAEFSPTIPIMKIKTCGRGPDRYRRLYCTTIKTRTRARGHNTTNGDT